MSINKIEEINVQLLKEANKNNALVGDIINYNITITNKGSINALSAIFKDDLSDNMEFVKSSFKLNNTLVNIKRENLINGIKIGNIDTGETILIEYSAKIISQNSSLQITNSASVKFNYICESNSIGDECSVYESNACEESTTVVNLDTPTFKQITVEEYLKIPQQRPTIKEIDDIDANVNISRYYVIENKEATSNEGQKIGEYKLIVTGFLNISVQYTTNDKGQSIQMAYYNIPFTTFIILPYSNVVGSKMEVYGTIEHLDYNMLDYRNIYSSTNIFISVKILEF